MGMAKRPLVIYSACRIKAAEFQAESWYVPSNKMALNYKIRTRKCCIMQHLVVLRLFWQNGTSYNIL